MGDSSRTQTLSNNPDSPVIALPQKVAHCMSVWEQQEICCCSDYTSKPYGAVSGKYAVEQETSAEHGCPPASTGLSSTVLVVAILGLTICQLCNVLGQAIQKGFCPSSQVLPKLMTVIARS